MSSIKNLRIIRYILLFTAVLVLAGTRRASAQLTGFQSMYFENQYLANPAMAGLDKGLNLNIGYQREWTNIPGSPTMQDFTGDYNAGKRVGLGFIITSEQAGLIDQTRVVGTYAYHLPVSENGKLSFGISFGLNDSYIDQSKIQGDQGDLSVQMFDQRPLYLDGDLGIAYTSNGFNLQAAVPNLGSILFSTQTDNLAEDRATFYTAASYIIPLSTNANDFTIEPKVAFRGIKGYSNIVDAGVNLAITQYLLNASVLYHTNKSATVGFSLNLKQLSVLLSYTYNTGQLEAYANNTFEMGLKYSIVNLNK
ncbi:PorP/SprF family type IX secretion system membrane protein [Mucilaginibacter sp.]